MKRVIVVLIVLLAACKKGSSSSSPGPGGGGSFDERQACSVDDDCVPVEIECCDHCNGGTVVGIHRDHATEVRNAYAGADECQGTACTLRACLEEPTGICRQGVCGIKTGAAEETPALPPP